MAKYVVTERFRKRGSSSVSKTLAKKNDYSQLPMPTEQFSFPIVKIKDLLDRSTYQSIGFRNHNLFATMPKEVENTNSDNEELFRKNSTTKHQLTTMSSNSPFYFPVIEKYDNNPEKHRNPKNLSQSVQVNQRTEVSKESFDITERMNLDSSYIISKTQYNPGSINLFTKISQRQQEGQKRSNVTKPFNFIRKTSIGLMRNLQTLAIRSSIKRFRIILIYVQAALRFSKNQRFKTKEWQKISQMKEGHKEFIDKFKIESVKSQQKKYVQMICRKLLSYTSERQYLRECELIWDKDGRLEKDMRRTRFCVLSTMFLQNLEFFTRNHNMPLLIKHLLNTCLFESENRKNSQFVAKRSQLFQKNMIVISQDCKLLSVTEYFLFDIVGANLVEIINDVKSLKISQKNQTLYYFVSILNLIQTLFTEYFQKVDKLQGPKIKPIQRKLNVSEDMYISIDIEIELDQDETQIISGQFQKNYIPAIVEERKRWGENVNQLFKQVILNLQSQIKTLLILIEREILNYSIYLSQLTYIFKKTRNIVFL